MSAKAKKKDTDIFDEEIEEKTDDQSIESEEDVTPPDDIKDGLVAESDPRSRMYNPLALAKGPAEDLISNSLKEQKSSLGRKTAQELDKQKKYKIMLPMDKLNPDDTFVTVATNGWVAQIKRNKPVMVPKEILTRLINSGETPTVVP